MGIFASFVPGLSPVSTLVRGYTALFQLQGKLCATATENSRLVLDAYQYSVLHSDVDIVIFLHLHVSKLYISIQKVLLLTSVVTWADVDLTSQLAHGEASENTLF